MANYRAVALFVDQSDPADELIYEEDVIENGGSISFDANRIAERQKAVDAAYDGMLKSLRELPLRTFALYNLLRPLSLADYFGPQSKYYRYVRLSLERPALIREFTVNPESERSRKTVRAYDAAHR